MKRRYFLSSWLLLSLAVLFAGQANAQYQYTSTTFSSDPYIKQINVQSQFYGYNSAVNRPTTNGQPAYNYSQSLMYDRSISAYRMYSGGRWQVTDGRGIADGDHVLQYRSATGAGGTWSMPHPSRPEWWNGWDFNPNVNPGGNPGTWWGSNALQPQTFKLNGTYYMYTQTEIDPGQPIDLPGQTAVVQADRIKLMTSPNGNDWTTFTDRGVVVNINNPTRTMLHHQEFVYAPWDSKPYHMYTEYFSNGFNHEFVLLRSNDPYTYDWNQKETTTNMSRFNNGHGIGYALQAPGGPLLTRAGTAQDSTGRWVPALEFSRNGTDWFWGNGTPPLLAGSTDNLNNANLFWMGLSTLDGDGELEYLGNNTYRAIYAGTTNSTGMSPEIYYSAIGVGEVIFTIVPEPSSLLLLLSGAGMALLTGLEIL